MQERSLITDVRWCQPGVLQAENLFISQSAVSARIKQLEDRIGAPLFTRNRNNIQLTAVGEKMGRHADAIVMAWGRVKQNDILQDAMMDSLVVAGVPGLRDVFTQTRLAEMYRLLRNTAIYAELIGQDQLLRQLLNGTAEPGFGFESPQVGELQVDEILQFELIMVSSEAGITAEQALGHNYIQVNRGASFATAHVRHFPNAPSTRLHVGVGRIAHEFLLASGGSAYLAEPMVRDDINAQKLHRVENALVIHRTAFAMYHPGSDKHSMIERAIKLAKSS
ncbi:MAG: LysR family transcriptional regulator [Gammaproteobacteria bacterium]|jgi:DNA-binding transcriptional LysR family regulator